MISFVAFCYILLILLLIIYFFIENKHQYWKRRRVPHPKPEFIYGNTRGIGKQFYHGELWKKVYNNFKSKTPIAGIYLFIDPYAIITDLDLVRNILVKDFNIFPNRGTYYNEKDDPISAHLVHIEDEKWRNLRNKLTPTFTSGKLKLMFTIIVQVVDNLLEKISNEIQITAQFEVKDILSRLTTDVIGKTAFGIECNSLNDKNSKFYQIGLKAFGTRNFLKRLLMSRYHNLARKLHIRLSKPEIAAFYRDIVDQTIKYREENNIESNDFMGLLIKMKNNSADPITFNEIWAQSTVFFLAGYETSATTLTYSMYELSIHKDLQRKARENVLNVLQKHNGEFTYEAVNEMQYVEQCINESLRLHSPVASTRRVAKKDYKVPNTEIVLEKGTHVIIPISAIHHDPSIYPDPMKFQPERFEPEQIAKRHHYSFIPFGEGNRICIGARFAMVEVKLALAKILANFEFDLDRNKTPVPLVYSPKTLILTPACGIFIDFKKFESGNVYQKEY